MKVFRLEEAHAAAHCYGWFWFWQQGQEKAENAPRMNINPDFPWDVWDGEL